MYGCFLTSNGLYPDKPTRPVSSHSYTQFKCAQNTYVGLRLGKII
jgi:hypothetical protein